MKQYYTDYIFYINTYYNKTVSSKKTVAKTRHIHFNHPLSPMVLEEQVLYFMGSVKMNFFLVI